MADYEVTMGTQRVKLQKDTQGWVVVMQDPDTQQGSAITPITRKYLSKDQLVDIHSAPVAFLYPEDLKEQLTREICNDQRVYSMRS